MARRSAVADCRCRRSVRQRDRRRAVEERPAQKRSAAARTSKARSSPGTGPAPPKAQKRQARRGFRRGLAVRVGGLAVVCLAISCQTSPLGGNGCGRGRATGRGARVWRSPQGDGEAVGGCRLPMPSERSAAGPSPGRRGETSAKTVGGGEDFEGVFVAGCGTSTSKGA